MVRKSKEKLKEIERFKDIMWELGKCKTAADFYSYADKNKGIGDNEERLGSLQSSRKYWEKSLAAYEKLRELEPNNAKVWNSLGWMFYKLGDAQKGLDTLDKSIQLDPKWSQPWINIGLIRISMKDYELALEAFETARELDPYNQTPLYNAGLIYYILDNMKKAKEYLSEARKIAPKSLIIHTNGANVSGFLTLQLPKEAREDALKSMKEIMEKDNPNLCLYCGAKVPEGQDKQDFCKKEQRKIIWETNRKLPKKAKGDIKYKETVEVEKSPVRLSVDHKGTMWLKRSTPYMGTMKVKRAIKEDVLPFYLNDFPPLNGTLCSNCADLFLTSVRKCFKNVKKSDTLSKIVKSMEKCFSEYLKLLSVWFNKVK